MRNKIGVDAVVLALTVRPAAAQALSYQGHQRRHRYEIQLTSAHPAR